MRSTSHRSAKTLCPARPSSQLGAPTFVGISIAILGGPRVYVDLHIVVKGDVTVREGHLLSHKVEDEILRGLPQVAEVLVHIEPEEKLTIKTERKRIVS